MFIDMHTMHVIALTRIDLGLPRFDVRILCTYDITGGMYPHSSVTSFPDLQCTCGKCAASKLDQQEETSDRKTRKLHTIVQTLGTDMRYMMFGSTMMSPALMRFLEDKGYTSLEQMLGYSGDIDDDRYHKWNLRPYSHPDSKKNGPAAPACDSDHCVWRLMGVLLCHSIYMLLPCAHATNTIHDYVREQCNDRCFGLSRIPYMSAEDQAAKEAADQLAAMKRDEKKERAAAAKELAVIKRAERAEEKKERAAAAKEAAIKRAEEQAHDEKRTICHRTFEEHVERLTAYKIEYGNCHVPHVYKRDPTLGHWVGNVRKGIFKTSKEQKQTLTELGFAWNITEINESKRQQMVLEVCLIVYLSLLSHNFTNIQLSLRRINRNVLKMLLSCGHLWLKRATRIYDRQHLSRKQSKLA